MGIYGAVLGKALYAGSLVLREVVGHFEQEA
jgi:phosphoribosylformimino-5-aminoimidazole carboxamide ribonucleotide (ProFAR) isomerase